MDTPAPTSPPAGSPPPPPFGTPRPRQLRRRPDEGHIAGVCAGLAEYFNVDPVLVRIAAVVLAISGPGIVAYILAWIFIPPAEDPAPRHPVRRDRRDRGTQVLGIVLLAVAVSVLWGDWWSPARRWMLPLGLMGLGAWLLLRRDRPDDEDAAGLGPATPPMTGAAPAWSAPPAVTADQPAHGQPDDLPTGDEPSDEEPTGERSLGDPAGQADVFLTDTTADATAGTAGGLGGPPPTAPWEPGWEPGAVEPTSTRRRRRMLGPVVMGALLVWSGIAWLAGISVESGLAVGLCIVGLGFVLGAFVGGSWPLVVPAVAIGGALLVATVVDIPLSGPIGDRTWAPRTVADVADSYEVSIGEGVLDLTDVPIGQGDRLDVEASVGVGHLVIEVPDDVAVEVAAEVGAGEARVFGLIDSGMGVSAERSFGDAGAGTIELNLQVGLGQIEVRGPSEDRRTSTSTTVVAPTTTTVAG
jgi:phage shock protein PspC (stress-responsive transcriptional regulator)